MKTKFTQVIIVSAALIIAGVCMVVFGQRASNGIVSTVLPLLGTGIFTAGLTYFLVKIG
jgi:hypothetical protein